MLKRVLASKIKLVLVKSNKFSLKITGSFKEIFAFKCFKIKNDDNTIETFFKLFIKQFLIEVSPDVVQVNILE